MKIKTACLFSLCFLSGLAVQASEPAAAAEPQILTPPAPSSPRINGARVVGVRPGHPFLFTIPATGERPMRFSATALPGWISLDAATGRLTGSAPANAGEYPVTLVANNAKGTDSKPLRIIVGEAICLTPPMGWSTWYCWAIYQPAKGTGRGESHG